MQIVLQCNIGAWNIFSTWFCNTVSYYINLSLQLEYSGEMWISECLRPEINIWYQMAIMLFTLVSTASQV